LGEWKEEEGEREEGERAPPLPPPPRVSFSGLKGLSCRSWIIGSVFGIYSSNSVCEDRDRDGGLEAEEVGADVRVEEREEGEAKEEEAAA